MRRYGAVAAVIAVLVCSAPSAAAEPPEQPEPPGPTAAGGAVIDAPTLPLADIGAGGTLSFVVNRDVAKTSLTFPVPKGLSPVALKTFLEIPVNLRSGIVTVSQNGRTISRLPLPPLDRPEMEIPLAGAEVFGGWTSFDVSVNAVPIEGYCWDPMFPIRFVNGSIVFAGTEIPPSTVAEFLPQVLRRVTIAVPDKPSRAESTAAVQVAAAVANRNGQQPDVVVVPLPNGAETLPAPSGPLERQIIVKEGPKKGLVLQGGPGVPALRGAGPGDELVGQARMFNDDALRFAVSENSAAETLPEQELATDTASLEQLKITNLKNEDMWPTVRFEINQTRWGHPIGGVAVHLKGSYTPIDTAFGGQVLVAVDGEIIERWPAEPSGTIDRTVVVPNKLLKRGTTVEVMVRTTGDPGHCGDHLPILLQLDSDSTVQTREVNPPLPQGFQSLPQAAMPRIPIGITDDAFADTVRAAQIMVGLQLASAVPLQADVKPLREVIAAPESAVLISSGGWNNADAPLPFTAEQGRLTVTGLDPQGQSVSLNLDPAPPFGSLQAVFDGDRTLLVATSTGAPQQLDELLRFLAAQPGRWPGLDGRAIISVPGTDPITVPNPTSDYSLEPEANQGKGSGESWFWWAVGGLAAVAAVGAVLILLRARRTTSRPDTASPSEDSDGPSEVGDGPSEVGDGPSDTESDSGREGPPASETP